MKYLFLVFVFLCQFLGGADLLAQKNFGKITKDISFDQIIEISVYHEYELSLKKGTVVLLNLTDFDVRTELTVVNSDGMIVEQMNTADTADFLIFESLSKGDYQLYINILEGEKKKGKYTLRAHYIPSNRDGKLGQIKKLLQLLEKPERAGVATAIIDQGKTVFEYYAGFSNVEHRLKNDDQTVFELASVSKQFTGMAIATLAEQGKLSVEDDIRKYFPELPFYKTPIKIKHLLNHTSGLIDSEYPLALAGFENDPIEIERVLNFLENTPDQYFESGTDFSYSNDGYTLLGELIHRVTNQTFRAWAKINIFDPLAMNNSLIRDSPEIVIPNRATSYVSYTGETHFRRLSFDFYAPGGCSVRSNISDLIKWVNYLNRGDQTQNKLFQRIREMETFENGDTVSYAYGNFITDFRGIERFSHLGLSAGFTTSIARFPEKNSGFIYLGNDGEFRNYYLARKIYEIYLEEQLERREEVFEGIETASPSQEEIENKVAMEDLNLSDYEGSYFSEQLNTNYTFKLIQDTLFALSAAYKPIPIAAISKDTFNSEEDFMEAVIFKRDYKNEVTDCDIYNDNDDQSISFRKFQTSKKWNKANHWKSDIFLESMKDTLGKIEETKTLTGFGVSVFDESEIFLQDGFGFSNVETKKSYSPESVQLIASVSKSITGMAVMKAMELGYFNLDDSINEYLPYPLIHPRFSEDDITIRHLLTHTSSLNDTRDYDHSYVFRKPLEPTNWPEPHHKFLPFYNNNEELPLSDFLNLVINPIGIWYNKAEMFTDKRPGTSFEYSNLGFALLGYIIERTTKTDFKDFTHKYIFEPLGMNSSTWELEKVDPIHHVNYYLENYKSCPYYSVNTIPDGGLYSNLIDMTKFLQEAIRGYAGRGTILSKSSYKEMFRSQSDLFEIEGGLGWDLSFPCCIGHAGNDFGTTTLMYFEPRSGIGRIIFSNISAEKEEVEDVVYGMMGLLFREE